MIAFPSMLAPCAKRAKMSVPEDLENFDSNVYPHWRVYINVQLGASLPYPSAHWDNAEIIAAIPDDQIRVIDYPGLLELGISVGVVAP